MADIIPFRRAKKVLARKKAETKAIENRAAFGRTKGEKQADQARKDKIDRVLNGAQLTRADQADEPV